MVEAKKQKSKWRMMWSAMGLATLLMASAAHAETSVTVISSGGPGYVNVGQSFSVTFSGTLNGKPGTGEECTASDVTWNWTATVSGPSGSQSYTGSSPSITVSYTPQVEGTYNVSASATASYKTSAECGGNGSKSGSANSSVEAFGTVCEVQ